MTTINNQMGIKTNYTTPKKAENKGIDLDAISIFMDKDAVSISKNDPDVPIKEWNFQLAEPTQQNLLKASGMKESSGGNVPISIIHTNDEHDPDFDKFAKEATVIHSREKVHGDENSFIVNTGDLTYESSNDKPGPQFFGPVPEILKAEGVEFVVPGNHEFQHGGKYLQDEILTKLDPEILLGNVTFKSGGGPLEHTKPFTIQDVNGVKVGILGLTTPKQKTKAHPKVGYDVNVESVQSSAARLVPEMKKAGAEVVVIIAHEGINRCVDTASSVPGIDVIVAGHDHQEVQDAKEVKNPDGRTSVVVEAASHCKYVGDLTLDVDPKSKEVVNVNYKLFSVQGVQPDPEVAEIIKRYHG